MNTVTQSAIRMKNILCFTLLLFLGVAATDAQSTDVWTATLDTGAGTLRLELHITSAAEGAPTAVVFSVDQGNARIPVDEIILANGLLEFTIQMIQANYESTLDESGTVAEGTWEQGGRTFPLTFTKRDPDADEGAASEETLQAAWVGTLHAGGMDLVMQYRIMTTADGGTNAYFDSITQGANGFTTTWSQEGTTLRFEVPGIGATYEGTINATGDVAEGQFMQAGNTLPLTLRKQLTEYDNANVWEKRPQRPQPPFPYAAEEVTFANTQDGVTLAGTLTLPDTPGPHPALALISGSGPQDRDESLMEHKPFLVLADYLSRQGIAVLRYDDRGFGESTGDFGAATSKDFARDASAAVDFLKSDPRIDAAKVGLVGHSEGGLIAPMVAADRDDLAFISTLR